MAVVAVTANTLAQNSATLDIMANLATASSTTDGFSLDCGNVKDDKLLLIFYNSGSTASRTMTIKAGGGIQGVTDTTVTVAIGKYAAITVESGKHKFTSGTYKGMMNLVPDNVELKLLAVVLP